MSTLTIERRFRGPARSGNGGYTAGALAERVARLPAVVEVTLRRPPPLDVAMSVTPGAVTVLSYDGETVAEARRADGPLRVVEPVPPAEAMDATSGFAGLTSHPFPTCFGCGTQRADGDGLRIFAGPVGAGRVAAVWIPHPSLATGDDEPSRVGVAATWAALDCTGGWSSDFEGRPAVLGRMTARLEVLPVVGEPHVVMGELLGRDGRKTLTASTLYDSDGRVVGRAAHVWIEIDPDRFN
ncbi:MAG: hypothetical protein ACRDPI_06945 [Nocardioidaceae bacterium]